tara:strand:- start:14902 stop:15672 length:771 start_codon:yes stop_codon:yes gene_type:complete
MLRVIKENVIFRNFILAIVTLVLLFVAWLKYLDIYTDHDNFIRLPDFKGIHITDLDSIITGLDLRYAIIDSIFDNSKKKGVVVNQDPLPGNDVKSNRRVYLTINSIQTRRVSFPDIFDLTLRQAVRILRINGLDVGKLEYQSNIAINKILDSRINGRSIKVGQEIYHGTTVDLVVGRGLSYERVTIPNLVGLSRNEANIILKSTSLNLGLEYFHSNVIDSNSAVIYRQYPESIDENKVSIGSSLDLYFKQKTENNK